MVQNEAN